MREQRFREWKQFRSFLLDYASLDRSRRSMFLFRGHSNANWPLLTTLDRFRDFTGNAERDRFASDLMEAFRREALGLDLDQLLLRESAFELLARHHGVPTPILDWSESPYVACYFAFAGVAPGTRRSVAVWMLDRVRPEFETEAIGLIDDPEWLRGNRRAISQRGVFTRINDIEQPIEEILGGALTKLVLPGSSHHLALADLDEMMINAGTLFGDLDGVAKAVVSRFLKT